MTTRTIAPVRKAIIVQASRETAGAIRSTFDSPDGWRGLLELFAGALPTHRRRVAPTGSVSPSRSSQRLVERGVDVQGGAREDREVAVGLLDEHLELGAAEDHALCAGVPQLVDDTDDHSA